MSTHTICFCGQIRKLSYRYLLLSGATVQKFQVLQAHDPIQHSLSQTLITQTTVESQ